MNELFKIGKRCQIVVDVTGENVQEVTLAGADIVKIVDAQENTVSFVQEIYDDNDQLIEVHQKYPVDTGHRRLSEDE